MSKRVRKNWTDKELESLIEDYGVLSNKELEQKYKRNHPSITQKCITSGIKNNRKKKWTPELEQKFSVDWIDKNNSIEFLMSKYDTTRSGLASKAKELKVRRRNKHISNEDIVEMVNMYNDGASLASICKCFDCDKARVKRFLKDSGVVERTLSESVRIYDINENYFDSIDTERKAYMYGFFYADGHLSPRGTVSFGIQERDGYILEEFLKDMESNNTTKKTMGENGRYYRSLSITNKHISETLRKYGVDGDKTYSAKFPKESVIGDDILRHFIRGFFDGDGTISKTNTSNLSASLVGTYNMMWSVSYIIEYFTGVKGAIREEPRSEKIYYYSVSGGKNVEKFLSFMYDDSSIYLTRKYNRYLNVLRRGKNIWEVRKRLHGSNGRAESKIAEKVLAMIIKDNKLEYSKRDVIEMISNSNGTSNANIAYHTKEIMKFAEISDDITLESRYGKFIVKYRNIQDKTIEDINID